MKAVLAVAVSVLLTGCITDEEIEVRQRLVTYAASQAAANGQDLPRPSSEFTYAGDDASDLLLHVSLTEQPVTRVNLPPNSTQLPVRLDYWLHKIRGTGGQVATCDASRNPGYGGAILAWVLGEVADYARREVNEYALYRPGGDVSAIIEVDPLTQAAGAVVFVNRDGYEAHKSSRYVRCA